MYEPPGILSAESGKKLALISGVTYIFAWVIGLLIASGGPKPDDPATKAEARRRFAIFSSP